ncbi:hypothetical protein RND81_02G246000 [Saponaria officinalis]|uniref:GAG-pre-integrase domain-containing protein n=1 Tax=Saponaria officinalis TaxID=3572 RepID=A0AAW1MX88_SAPOF
MLRSNMLMMDPLPTVEHTVSLVLQEEMQSSNLSHTKHQEHSTLMSKGEIEREKCVHCGRDNHRSEMCWEVKGYPVGHPKHKRNTYRPGLRGGQTGGFRQQRPYQNNFKQQNYRKSAASPKSEPSDLSAAIGAATQQLETLLKMVPGGGTVTKTGGKSEDELECNYAGMTHKNFQTVNKNDWIIDSGATNHMTSQLETLENVKELSKGLKINLPDGRYVQVTHKGDITLKNGLKLKGVLYVPEFRQNLMSVQRLAKENQCYITFCDSHCYVQEYSKGGIKELGKTDSGLYYFKDYKKQNKTCEGSNSRGIVSASCRSNAKSESVKESVKACNENSLVNKKSVDDYTLWHKRLGHAPWSKIKYLSHLQHLKVDKNACLICPMAKFV